mgnify:CR=1 FL=1
MTSYVVADQIENDLLSLNETVLITEDAKQMSLGTARTYIEPGKRVTVLDLLKGVIIQSGNDATYALAEHVGGTEDGFVDLMNRYAAEMGLSNTLFQNSTGLPDANHFTSAKDLATMTSLLISKFPEIYAFHKEKEFTFNNITQPNRNRLLWKDKSSDGVKTGWTESAGYCLISSAQRNDMRLIAVIAGAETDKDRFNDTQRLLEYGFRFYSTQEVIKKDNSLKEVNIWGGKKDSVSLGAQNQYERIGRALEEGKDVDSKQLAILTGGAIGATEALPVGRVFGALANILKKVPKDAKQEAVKTIRGRLKSAGVAGLAEGGQEVTAAVLQDLTEKGFYNPDLEIAASAYKDDAIYGGGAGATRVGESKSSLFLALGDRLLILKRLPRRLRLQLPPLRQEQ